MDSNFFQSLDQPNVSLALVLLGLAVTVFFVIYVRILPIVRAALDGLSGLLFPWETRETKRRLEAIKLADQMAAMVAEPDPPAPAKPVAMTGTCLGCGDVLRLESFWNGNPILPDHVRRNSASEPCRGSGTRRFKDLRYHFPPTLPIPVIDATCRVAAQGSRDRIRAACEMAVTRFDPCAESAGTFNAACFSSAFAKVAGSDGVLDGDVVRSILASRDDVEFLSGGAHFKLNSRTEIAVGGPPAAGEPKPAPFVEISYCAACECGFIGHFAKAPDHTAVPGGVGPRCPGSGRMCDRHQLLEPGTVFRPTIAGPKDPNPKNDRSPDTRDGSTPNAQQPAKYAGPGTMEIRTVDLEELLNVIKAARVRIKTWRTVGDDELLNRMAEALCDPPETKGERNSDGPQNPDETKGCEKHETEIPPGHPIRCAACHTRYFSGTDGKRAYCPNCGSGIIVFNVDDPVDENGWPFPKLSAPLMIAFPVFDPGETQSWLIVGGVLLVCALLLAFNWIMDRRDRLRKSLTRAAGEPDTQEIVFTNSTPTGSFTLTYHGFESPPLAFDTAPDRVSAELNVLMQRFEDDRSERLAAPPRRNLLLETMCGAVEAVEMYGDDWTESVLITEAKPGEDGSVWINIKTTPPPEEVPERPDRPVILVHVASGMSGDSITKQACVACGCVLYDADYKGVPGHSCSKQYPPGSHVLFSGSGPGYVVTVWSDEHLCDIHEVDTVDMAPTELSETCNVCGVGYILLSGRCDHCNSTPEHRIDDLRKKVSDEKSVLASGNEATRLEPQDPSHK